MADSVQAQCEKCVDVWLRGDRNDAGPTKQALLQLIQQHPKNSLPRRYLARLMFHEAAGAISPGTVGSNSSLQRIQLLTDAYEHAAVATALSPNSLSCAALRATLAINLLVEESALLTPTPPSTSSAGSKAGPEQQSQQQQQASSCTMLDRKCQELLQRFLGSIDACKTALEHPNPVLREPLITFTTATHTTCDPCSLLVEKIMDCSRAGKLQEVVAEKRSVLTSMQQVLQSCYALLDSTQVPLHSIIRLLQHILRPYGAEQQMLASSRVNSSSPPGTAAGSSNPVAQLPASQLHHAAIGELLRLLRPGSNQACSNAAIAATTAAAAAAATAAGNAAAAMAGAAAAVVAPAAAICEAAGSGPVTDDGLAPLPLSVEKPWDPPSTTPASTGSKAAAGNARGAGKGRNGRSRAGGAAAGPGKKRERSRRERFMDVESFWRSCSPQQRLQLLRVPLAPLLAGVKQESGAPAAEVLMEGLVLLREQEHSSCYWLCAACDRKFHTARDFNTHLETCHEQLVLAKQQQQLPLKAPLLPPGPPAAGKALAAPQQQQLPVSLNSSSLPPPVKYISCGKCQAPVVGMYYIRTPPAKPAAPQAQPQMQTQQPAAAAAAASTGEDAAAERMRTICIKCYRELTTLMGAAGAERSYCMVTPHAPLTPSSSWSGSGSEFISTRGSFSSCGDDDGASSGSLTDSDDPVTATAAAATARSMQLRPYDNSTRGAGRGGQGAAAGVPEGKQRGQPWPAWRLQQQRALAWRTHMPDTLRCSSSQGCGRACGPSVNGPQSQQQPGQRQQQQQASAPAPGPGIFVFGSSSNSGAGAGAGSSCTASGSNAAGSFVPTSPVPATAASVGAGAGAAAAPAGPSEGVAAVQSGLLSPSSCNSSPVRPRLPPPQQQQHLGGASGSSGLAAYWQQQQLLLCSADAAAVELLDGLDIVQRAKQLNSHQRRASAAAAHTSQRLSGPMAGTKRPAAAADGDPATAAGVVVTSQHDLMLPPSVPAFQAPGAVHTGLSAEGEAAAGEFGAGVGPDTGTPSASNRTWRDWLLPKKLLQWNDGDDEGGDGSELYRSRRSSFSSDDTLDDVISRGLGHACSGGPGVSHITPAAAAGGLPDGSSGSNGGCSSGQQQGRRGTVPTVVISELSDEPAAGGEGPEQCAGSAPCSPRTPSAQDSCRGGADTGGTSSGAVVVLPVPSSGAGDAGSVSPATAAAAAAANIDSLGACLAAAAPAVLVDELIRCMQHLYSTDADVADEALHCLVDFLQRKLNPKGYRRVNCDTAVAAMVGASRRCSSGSTLSLEQLSPAAAAAAEAAGLSEDEAALAAELLAAPELAFMCPRAMRAAMCCLSSSDLHMALAYIVRQSGAPLAGATCVDVDSTCGSSGGRSTLASSSGAGSVTGEEDLGDTASQTDSQESDEESGCMALFQLYHLDEVAFEELVTHLWPGEFRLRGEAPAGDAAAAVATAGKGSAPPATAKNLHGGAQQGRPAGKAAAGSAASAQGGSQAQKDRLEPVLLVAPWWLEHLRQSSKAKDQTGDAEADMRVLRWVYGNIESAQAEELAGRQAALRGGLDRTSALWELYEGLAEAWRRMQRVADRQRRLEQLRSRVKAKFAEVKALEDAAQHGTSQQAAAFLESLSSSLSLAPAPAPAPALLACSASGSTPAALPETALVPATAADSAPAAAVPPQQQPPAACAAAAAAVSLSPLMQLTTYMTKLAPLYLCEPAVAAVRTAPLLASEASQHFACTLLERELAVLALMEAKLEHDVALARQRLQAANDRLLAKRGTELSAAEAEQSKLIAEGPASHRKKDLLDKATKETEHRQKLADVKARIEAAKAAIAEDEALAASAELAAAEGTAALLHVQDLARQMNMRLKTLQDFNAQLAALLPPLHAPAPAAAPPQQQCAAAVPGSCASSNGSAAYGSPNSNSVDSSACSSSPQVDAEPAPPAAAAPAAPSAFADAHAEWTLRARRLECLMCRVLWVAETIRLFDGQYDTHSVAAGSTSTSTAGGSSAPAPAAQGAAAGGAAQGLVGPQGYSQARTTPTDMLSASRWVKAQGEELDANFHAAAEELGLLRSRIQQLACVDLTFELHEAALNYVRRRIEAASTAAQEMRSQQLLLELAAEEEAAKKAAAAPTKQQQHSQHTQAAAAATAAAAAEVNDKGGSSVAAGGHPVSSQGAGSTAAGAAAAQQQPSGKAGKGKKGKQQEQSKPAASKPTPKATSKQQIQQVAAAAEETAKREAAERLQAREAARAAREAAIEAELEKRRQELLAMEEAAEAELIRLAEEASLREQQALKEAAETECQKKEQQAREAAAAAAAAAAAPAAAQPVGQSPRKQQQHPGSGSPVPAQAGSGRAQQGTAGAAGRVPQGKQQGAAAVARGAPGSAGSADQGQGPVGVTSPVRPAAAHRASRVQLTGPGAAQAVSRDVGKQAAVKPPGSMAAAPPAAATPAALSKRQQQAAGAAAATAGTGLAGKKGGRGGQAAAAGGRGGKGQPGSAGSTPSKQQRSQHKQQERGQLPPPPPPPQPVPVMLDFGPTPAEAYAAKQAQGVTAAAAAAGAAQPASQEESAQQHSVQQQQQEMPFVPQQQQMQGVVGDVQQGSSPVAAVAAGTAGPASPAAAPGLEAFGLTAADAVVHMPSSTASSSSHLALLSQGHPDGSVQPLSIPSNEPRSRFDSSSAPLSAAPGSAFAAAASIAQPGAAAAGVVGPVGSSAGLCAPSLGHSHGSQAFTADAPLTGFSPAPGGPLLSSVGSGHLQYPGPAGGAGAAHPDSSMRTLSGSSSLLPGLSGTGQGFGSQDVLLGFGLGAMGAVGGFSASRQGSAGLQGPGSSDLTLTSEGPSSMSGGGSKGVAAVMGVGAAVSAPLTVGSGPPSVHLRPPRPALGAVGGAGDSLLGGGGVSGGLDTQRGMFGQAGGAPGLGVQLQSAGGRYSGLDSVLQDPESPQLGCSPAGDALHIQSIMSLLDDTGSSSSTHAQPAAAAANAAGGSGGGGRGRQGKKQQQQHDQQKQPQRQQQRQRGQKGQHMQQQQQQRPGSRGRNSPAPDSKGAMQPGRGADGLAPTGVPSGSISSGSESFGQAVNPSASSSLNSVMSPMRPPGLSGTTGSLSSRPSSAGSTSTAPGEGLGGVGAVGSSQRQQQMKQGGSAAAAPSSGQLWGGSLAAYGSAMQAGGAGQAYSSSSWAGAGAMGLDTSGPSSGDMTGSRGAAGQGAYAAAGTRDGTAAAAAAMAAGGGVWSGPRPQLPSLPKGDLAAGRDQQRPGSAGMGGYPTAAQANQHAQAHAHMAAATAAAAAAAAATAAVKQAQQQAAAVAAVAGHQAGGGLRSHSPGLAGLYSQGQQDMAALFGGSSNSLLGAGPTGGLSVGQGYLDASGGFGGLTSGALSGGFGAPHGGMSSGLADVAGLWQQQQQQQAAAALRYPGGLGGLQQSLQQQQQQQQQQMWSRPPSAGGGQGVQW